jgi:hypothetical protein
MAADGRRKEDRTLLGQLCARHGDWAVDIRIHCDFVLFSRLYCPVWLLCCKNADFSIRICGFWGERGGADGAARYERH